MSERALGMVKDLRMSIKHDRARYEGDGDPGCSGSCKACLLEDLEDEIKNPTPADMGH